MKKCPKCGSKRVAPILYGMPAFNEEMEQKLKKEKLYIGGCCISDINPEYHCFGCGKGVGTPPVLVSKYGTEDYRDIVTSVRFTDGGYGMGYPEIIITKDTDSITMEVIDDFHELEVFQRKMSKSEWNKLLDRLFCKLYVHEWKKRYYENMKDGEQWELGLKLTGGRVRNYYGSNAFPPYWDELKAIFRPFFKEAGIDF